jgi:hypothetical protein
MSDRSDLPEGAIDLAVNGHPESWRETIEAAVARAAPALRKQGAEEAENQLRECEESLRSLEEAHAEFRKQMLEPLKDEGGSIESLSWDRLLGVAIRNGNEAMRAADERDQALAKGAEEERERLASVTMFLSGERFAALDRKGYSTEEVEAVERWIAYCAGLISVEPAHVEPLKQSVTNLGRFAQVEWTAMQRFKDYTPTLYTDQFKGAFPLGEDAAEVFLMLTGDVLLSGADGPQVTANWLNETIDKIVSQIHE